MARLLGQQGDRPPEFLRRIRVAAEVADREIRQRAVVDLVRFFGHIDHRRHQVASLEWADLVEEWIRETDRDLASELELGASLVHPAGLAVGEGELVVERGGLRLEIEGSPQRFNRFLGSVERDRRLADTGVRGGLAGIYLEGTLKKPVRGFVRTHLERDIAEVEKCLNVVGFEFENSLIRGHRLFVIAGPLLDEGQVVGPPGIFRRQNLSVREGDFGGLIEGVCEIVFGEIAVSLGKRNVIFAGLKPLYLLLQCFETQADDLFEGTDVG